MYVNNLKFTHKRPKTLDILQLIKYLCKNPLLCLFVCKTNLLSEDLQSKSEKNVRAMVFYATFNNISVDILAVSFIGGEKRST